MPNALFIKNSKEKHAFFKRCIEYALAFYLLCLFNAKMYKLWFSEPQNSMFINAWFLSNSSENKQNLMSNKFLFFLSDFSQFEAILYFVLTRHRTQIFF